MFEALQKSENTTRMKTLRLNAIFLVIPLFFSCNQMENKSVQVVETKADQPDFLSGFEPITPDGHVNAIIEIPAGTTEKWELNKENGKLERDSINGQPRTIHYLGYPGNYGMIPKTLLPKESGGDGDPLDVLVIGDPVERGTVVNCKLLGVLYLLDSGEQDDKLIAVDVNSLLYPIIDLEDLDSNYVGITAIIEQWFLNYKGPGEMVSKGYGSTESAREILNTAVQAYQSEN